ncbi:MAG: DNA mismatch repair protein MutS [Myxococcota bacterium]
MSAESPASIYSTGEAGARVQVAFWRGRAALVSNLRLACFAALAVVAWLAFGTRSLPAAWLGLPAAAFVALVVVHDRVLGRATRAERLARFHGDGLARLEHRFAGRGDPGLRHLDPAHPYARDLDLFGTGSLFELLATTRTREGSDRLAGWLLAPAPPAVIRARQQAVAELRDRLDLRQALALAGGESAAPAPAPPSAGPLDPGARGASSSAGSAASAGPGAPAAEPLLAAWAGTGGRALPRALPWLSAGASALTLAGVALWIWSGSGPVPLAFALALQGGLALAMRGRVVPVLQAAQTPVDALARFEAVLGCFERERFASPRLVELGESLRSTGRLPSEELRRLRGLIDRRDERANQFFAPIAALLGWGTQVACALDRWRLRCGPRLGAWVDAAAELEALCALAGFAFENPEAPFPELREDAPIFEATALGHPLIARERRVRNDLRLGARPQAIVMSGSNMSGKSTFLRTVGVNAVLAQAGAPVLADRLVLSPLHLAASIRIVDSLEKGESHFMAEILRLRQVVEVARTHRPALFLLDEILHGTNSHDRRIGAEAVIRGLVERGALGIVTTHDLALTEMVPGSEGRLANFHFEDHLEGGVMRFDYRLREGVVAKSNAVALMRSVGLDV